MIETRFAFNMTTQAASIEYWDDTTQEKVSEWVLNNNVIHADEVTVAADYPLSDILDAVALTRQWHMYIVARFGLPLFPQSKHKFEIQKKPGKVKIYVEIGGVQYRDDEWDSNTDLVTFNPRPEINFSWADYTWWIARVQLFMDECVNFSKGG